MKAGEACQQASGNTAAIPNAMDSGINALLSLAAAANSSADYPSKFAELLAHLLLLLLDVHIADVHGYHLCLFASGAPGIIPC